MKEILVVVQGVITFSVIVFGIWWLTKKLSHVIPGANGSGYMKVMDRMAVSQDKYLMLINVGGRCFLMSVEPSGTKLLQELDPSQLEKVAKPAGGGSGPGQSSAFHMILSRLKEKGDGHE